MLFRSDGQTMHTNATSGKKYSTRSRKSAFDDDPEVILARAKQQSGGITTNKSINGSKQRFLNPYSDSNAKSNAIQDNSSDMISLFTSSSYQQSNNFNTFDKVNTKLLTQLRDAVTRSPTYNDYDNSFVQKMHQADLPTLKQPTHATLTANYNNTTSYNCSNSALTTVTSTIPTTKTTSGVVAAGIENNNKLDLTNTSAPSETYESTHTGSDDARAPKLPKYAYGTRTDQPQGTKGIYEKQSISNQESSQKALNHNEVLKETELQTQNSILNADYLRQVDKNLKKLLKKNIDQPKKFENIRKKVNAVAWDIDVVEDEDNDETFKDESVVDTTNDDDNLIISHPYLPLRDVPMNNVAKKLQHELELECELNSCLPKDLHKMWEKLQFKLKSNEKLTKSDVKAMEKLEKIFKNPINGLVDLESQTAKPISTNKENEPINKIESKACNVENDEQEFKKPIVPLKQELNSAATQTSFVIEPKRAKKSNDIISDAQADPDKQKKLKIHALIRKQKQEHEERLKMLEKLAKLERLQAEKMKKIMLLNHNDTITSSIMADSYFQDNESIVSNQTSDDLTQTLTDNDSTFSELIQEKKASLEKLDQKYKKKLQQHQQQQNDKRTSYVQVVNLKNTSVYEPPEGFYVVKEKKADPPPILQSVPNKELNQNALLKVQKQTNDIFVTIPVSSSISGDCKGNANNNSRSLQNPLPKPTAWFQPVVLVSETTREPLVKHKKSEGNRINSTNNNSKEIFSVSTKSNRTSVPRSPVHLTANSTESFSKFTNNFDRAEELEVKKKPQGLKKMTLQEAFEMFNFDVISRSRKRLKEIKIRAEERRHEEQFKRERIHLGIDSDANSIAQRHIKHSNLLLKHHPLSDNLFLAQRRPMTSEQIKQQTNKIYKKLPEVKDREKRVRVEEERKLNRLKSNIYNRVS